MYGPWLRRPIVGATGLSGYAVAMRHDSGPEYASAAVRKWLKPSGAKTLHTASGSLWENGYVASFNIRLPDE